MNHIELFGGAVRANTYLLVLNGLLLVHFAYSYRRHCHAKGFKVDYWHFTMFTGFVFPFLVLYPFAGSFLNVFATKSDIFRIQEFVDKSYVITAVGYVFVYLGFYYHNATGRRSGLYALTNAIANRVVPYVEKCVDNSASFYICYLFALGLGAIFLGIAFAKYGVSLNLRGYTLGDPGMRPFFNFVMPSLIPAVGTFALIRYLHRRERLMLALFAVLGAIGVFSGSRAALLSPVVTATLFHVIRARRTVSLARYAIVGCILLLVFVCLSDVREGRFSPAGSLRRVGYHVAYGNNFSDIRDFGWILSYWDGEYLLGRSYGAAFLSFVPRFLSEFRSRWAISLYTNRLVGLDPAMHPGLRPGKFGESYLNFGLVGVVMTGFLAGFVLRFVDIRVKEIAEAGRSDIAKMYASGVIYEALTQFYVSGAFWRLYVLAGILVLGYVARQWVHMCRSRLSHAYLR